MTLRFRHADLPRYTAGRRKSFVAAVEAVARFEGEDILVESADWHRLTREHMRRPTLLGDAVARVAKPIARAIDRATAAWLPARWHTRLASCRPCQQRQSALNTLHGRARSWWARVVAWAGAVLSRR